LVASLSPADPLADHRAEPGHEEVLDEDRALRQFHAIHDSLRAGLHHRHAALAAPLVETQPSRAEKRLLPVVADPPAHVAYLAPAPCRGLEEPLGRAQPEYRSEPPSQPPATTQGFPSCGL